MDCAIANRGTVGKIEMILKECLEIRKN